MLVILFCRPNKDDGKKNEERTGVKKKGEYYSSNYKMQLVEQQVVEFKLFKKNL